MHRLLRSWREPTKLFLAARIPVLVIMYLALLLVPIEPKPGMWRAKPENLFLDGWFRWDTGWYIHIAADGYNNLPNPEGQSDVAFWPLFPLLAHLVAKVFGTTDWAVVMFSLNHVLLAGCTYFLYHLARKRHGTEVARLATILFLTYPYAMYYSAGYSEPTYLFFTLGAFYFANDERWAPATIFAGIGTAARGVAITTAIGIAVMYLEKRRWDVRKLRLDVLWLVVGFAGFAAYTIYLAHAFGDPFLYAKSFTSKGWGAEISTQRLWDTLSAFQHWDVWPKGQLRTQDLLCFLAFTGVALLTLAGIGRVAVGETVFAVLSLLVYAKMWVTAGRYVGTIFPVYLTLAQMLRPRPQLQTFVRTTFATLLALFTVLFGHWVWLSG